MNLAEYIRDVPDFPKKGIVFKDITPLLADARAFRYALNTMANELADFEIDVVAGIESRGFIFGAALAKEIGCGFVPIRKPGKLPWKTSKVEYVLEYGTDTIEIHQDAVLPGQRVALVDDLLATGGTLEAAARLIESIKAEVPVCLVLVELDFLKGRKRLGNKELRSLIHF